MISSILLSDCACSEEEFLHAENDQYNACSESGAILGG